MKKFIYGVLGLVIFYFICAEIGRTPEGDFVKYMKKKYNKEFTVDIYSTVGNLYSATLYPKEFEGTPKENDTYYEVKGSMQNNKVKENYINVMLQDQINDFYLPKLKELFGENVLPIFSIEGECEKDNFQEEIARRMKFYKEEPNPNYDPLIGNIYIFGKVKNNQEKEIYREKIFKFIEYMRETNTFEYTSLLIKIIDDESFKKNTYEVILKKEAKKIEKDTKEINEELISEIKNPSSIVTFMVTGADGKQRRAGVEEINQFTQINEIINLTNLVTEKGITEENFKDLKTILKSIKKCDVDYLFNKYGKVLLSTYIVSPKIIDNLSYSGKGYINLYGRKEDICFVGEEQNYPNGTIKELGEKWSYYITETKNNKKNGISIQYDTKGNILWEGEYKNNKLDGPFKEYGEYWIEEGMYKNNLIEGEVKSTHKTDGITIKEIYRNGLLDGEKIYYNTDGSIDTIYEYKKGKLNGISKDFRGDGKLYEVTEWKDDEKNGKYIKYDSKGRIEKFIEYKNGMVDGVYKEFYKGQILLDKKYKNNEEYGLTKMYYQNGNIKKEIMYDKGHKLWDKSYSEEGKLKIYNIYDEKYSKVKLRKVYDRDEKLSKEVEYTKDGIEIVREYREKDGTLVSTRYFKDGVEQRNCEK